MLIFHLHNHTPIEKQNKQHSYFMSRQYHFALPPQWIIWDLIDNKILELILQLAHELGPWCDAIGIESGSIWQRFPLLLGLCLHFLSFLGRPEPPASLLVHFGARCHPVHRHEKQFLWVDHSEQHLDVVEYVLENFLLGYPEMGVVVIWMGTIVDDAVHV